MIPTPPGTNQLASWEQLQGCAASQSYNVAGEAVSLDDCSANNLAAYTRDDFGRMIGYDNSNETWDYYYDSSRMRLRKSTNGLDVDFAYLPGGQLISMEAYAGGALFVLYEYIYLGSRPIAMVVAQIDGSGNVTGRSYQVIASDHLGTPWAVVDNSDPSSPFASWKAAYDPFGKAHANDWEAFDLGSPITEAAGTTSNDTVARPPLGRGVSIHIQGMELEHECEWLAVRNDDTGVVEHCYTGTGINASGNFWTPETASSSVTLMHLVPASCGVPVECSGAQAPVPQTPYTTCTGTGCAGYTVAEVRATYGTGLFQQLRFPGQVEDWESGLHYNWHRYYSPTSDRYLSSDPANSLGGIYAYALNNPISSIDPLGLYTEVIVWQPVTWTTSSFGHVSANINGRNYSWAPRGWDGKSATASDYARRQKDFREGVGVSLELTPEQEKKLTVCLFWKGGGEYSAFSNNCGDPILDCLEEVLGGPVSDSFFPVSILNGLLVSPYGNGVIIYPGPDRGYWDDAFWAGWE